MYLVTHSLAHPSVHPTIHPPTDHPTQPRYLTLLSTILIFQTRTVSRTGKQLLLQDGLADRIQEDLCRGWSENDAAYLDERLWPNVCLHVGPNAGAGRVGLSVIFVLGSSVWCMVRKKWCETNTHKEFCKEFKGGLFEEWNTFVGYTRDTFDK